MTSYNIPSSTADRYRLAATLIDIRANGLDAGHDVSAVEAYLRAIVEAEVQG
jgi:hypothetical protein